MNKVLKKVLIFILSLVIIVIIVIMVQILLPRNRTNETAPTSPPISASPSPVQTSTASQAPSPSLEEKAVVMREETPNGALYTVTVPGGYVGFQLTVDETVFKTEGYGADGMLFRSIKDQSAYVRVDFVKGAKASDLAPKFLNTLIEYKEFEQSGDNYIDGTKISGETVIANDGIREMTAWLVDTDNGVLSVAISLTMADKTSQMPQLDKVLASLIIKDKTD